MVDTFILEIPIESYQVRKPERFKPFLTADNLRYSGFRTFKNNPTKEDKKEFGYLPKLTCYKRGFNLMLKIEFSAPKMIFGDNINEVEESHFGAIVSDLRGVIEHMGVRLAENRIRNANVLGFHPSKNIILNNQYPCFMAIKELSKVDVSQKYDLDYKQYRSGGETLQFYSRLFALVFYDKIRDLPKKKKRAIDKDQTSRQLSLFEKVKEKQEILRIEARIGGKVKMREIFKKIGFEKDIIFENLFNKDLCQKIVKYCWDYFFKDQMFLFDIRDNPQKVLNLIFKKYQGNEKLSIKKLFSLVGFCLCAKDEAGMIGARKIIEFYKPKNNWSNTKKWLDNFRNDLDKNYQHGFIKDIENQIEKFEPLRIEN